MVQQGKAAQMMVLLLLATYPLVEYSQKPFYPGDCIQEESSHLLKRKVGRNVRVSFRARHRSINLWEAHSRCHDPVKCDPKPLKNSFNLLLDRINRIKSIWFSEFLSEIEKTYILSICKSCLIYSWYLKIGGTSAFSWIPCKGREGFPVSRLFEKVGTP